MAQKEKHSDDRKPILSLGGVSIYSEKIIPWLFILACISLAALLYYALNVDIEIKLGNGNKQVR